MAQSILARCLKSFESMPKVHRQSSKAKAAELQLRIAQAILGKKIELMEASAVTSPSEVSQHNLAVIANLESLLLQIKGL
mgnify:CR=1 FL=1